MIYEIPNNYLRSNKRIFAPAYKHDLEHFIYMNLDEPINDADFANWALALYDKAGNAVVPNLGTLNKDVTTGAFYRFSITFTISNTVPLGLYYPVIYNTSTNDVVFQGNQIRVINDEQAEKYVYCQYKNSSNLFNTNFSDTYMNVFLEVNLIEQQPEIALQQYRELSTGKIRNQKTQTAKVLTLETYFFDEGANDMMLALSVHDDIMINGITVKVKTPFKIITNKYNSTTKGTIEFYDQRFSTVNYS